MNSVAVGTNLISEQARKAILTCGGRIESTLDPSIAMVILPDSARIMNENGGGEHVYIALDANEETILHFARAWETKDCRLELCDRDDEEKTMKPEQEAKIREAIEACMEEQVERENFMSYIQGYLAIEEAFEEVRGPVPMEWIWHVICEIVCPLCPEWDTPNLIESGFFGDQCQVNGVDCCETCYNIHHLTNEEDTNPLEEAAIVAELQLRFQPSAKVQWHKLRRAMYEKGYTYYCGYNGRDIAILGHPDGWPSVFSACADGLTRALGWLELQPQGLSEDERIERRATCWEERRLIEASVPDTF